MLDITVPQEVLEPVGGDLGPPSISLQLNGDTFVAEVVAKLVDDGDDSHVPVTWEDDRPPQQSVDDDKIRFPC